VSTSCAFGCPIEGYVSPQKVLEICGRLEWAGADALSFGDTTGMANPRQVHNFFKMILEGFPSLEIITHFHDSRGMGLANILAAIDAGVTIHDCALGGAGGQPSTSRDHYAYGRIGNVCTEDVVSMLEEMGVHTGIDLEKLIEAAKLFEEILGRDLYGYVSKAGPVKALWGGGQAYLDYFINKFGYKDS
jgi:hydroxymethylglutaryl-CoA lyase